jgi:hypothetical protein
VTVSEILAVIAITVLGSILIVQSFAYPAHKNLEKSYQAVWCSDVKGTAEYVLPDKTRVDCLTKEYAVEFDFAPKWAESIGQALHYGILTNRTPGVVLILEKKADVKYLVTLQKVASKYGITVWFMKPEDLKR